MTAYWIALWLSLMGALWLIPKARSIVLALIAWTALSAAMDAIQFYEFKLFLDFFGAFAVVILTLRDVVSGRYWIGKKACAYLCLSSTAISALSYGLANILFAVRVPLNVFPVLMEIHGWLLCATFFVAVWSLAWGAGVSERFANSLSRLGRVRFFRPGVLAAQEAHHQAAYSGKHQP